MSYYAKVLNGTVINVISAEAEFFDTFVDTSPGTWLQTSYNTRGGIHYGPDGQPDGGVALRANYAQIGGVYNEPNDVFYAARPVDINGIPCASWTIAAPEWIWNPPIPMPSTTLPAGEYYGWDEITKSWIIVPSSGV